LWGRRSSEKSDTSAFDITALQGGRIAFGQTQGEFGRQTKRKFKRRDIQN
jgi:hypothetical protein